MFIITLTKEKDTSIEFKYTVFDRDGPMVTINGGTWTDLGIQWLTKDVKNINVEGASTTGKQNHRATWMLGVI